MSGLSDRGIRQAMLSGGLAIEPLGPRAIQPATVDVRLSNQFRTYGATTCPFIDPRVDNSELMELVTVEWGGHYVLHPRKFVLASTLEYVEIPSDLVCRVEGKSSLARIGLMIHSTAGFVDPGFRGTITLEMSNVAELPVLLLPGMKIGQLSFSRLESPALVPYGSDGLGSKYQDQREPTASRLHLEFVRDE